jgi:hypothetical protein
MIIRTYIPRPPLSDFVEVFWLYEGFTQPMKERALPAGELHNAHVSLDMLWGAKAVELRERLLEVKTPEAKFRILEQALLAHASRSLTRHPAVAFASGRAGQSSGLISRWPAAITTRRISSTTSRLFPASTRSPISRIEAIVIPTISHSSIEA